MSSSHNQPQNEFPWNCVADIALGKPVDFSNLAHGILIALIVIHAVTCPMTILSNLLVMIAVKTKVRLQRMSNIALACLASTDLMVGLVGQPLLIAVTVNLLKTTAEACSLQTAVKFFAHFFMFASFIHLFLITMDWCIAITRPYVYIQSVTKARVLIGTALAWTLTVIIHIVFFIDHGLFEVINSVLVSALIAIILLCNVIGYREARRHEKQIASQQVDAATRGNFLSQKRAFKLTLTIIAFVIISFLPMVIFRISIECLKDIVTLGTLWAILAAASSLAVLNSFVNPLIYYLRLRQFRVALIELLMRKNRNEAEEFERTIFGSTVVANRELIQRREGGSRRRHSWGGGRRKQDNAMIYNETCQVGEREKINLGFWKTAHLPLP